jgi:hypothetical protein
VLKWSSPSYWMCISLTRWILLIQSSHDNVFTFSIWVHWSNSLAVAFPQPTKIFWRFEAEEELFEFAIQCVNNHHFLFHAVDIKTLKAYILSIQHSTTATIVFTWQCIGWRYIGKSLKILTRGQDKNSYRITSIQRVSPGALYIITINWLQHRCWVNEQKAWV